MAGYDDGESVYGDDNFDALPVDALEELETNAIQYTQAQTQAARPVPPPSSDYGDDFDDEDLDDAVVIDESRSTPATTSYPLRHVSAQPAQREPYRHPQHGPSSNTNSTLPNRTYPKPPPAFNQPNRFPVRVAPPQNESMRAEQGSQPSTAPNSEVERLQRMVEELTRERNTLKNDVNAKAGEISIVRSKHDTTVKEFEREMIAQRKLGEDKLAKQQKALEAARIAEKNAATERDFVKRDLQEESERVRKLNKAREAESKGGAESVTTPKKKKTLAHRDGFDDDEIEILSPSNISPSKFQKRNAGSPSKPGKRKRKTIESPAGALQVIHPEEQAVAAQNESKFSDLDEALIAKLGIHDDRFDFLGMMLDHSVDSKHLRTLEEFGKHAYPSSPQESFQAIILGKIPSLGYKKQPKDLSIDFCELLITMWTRCVEEKYCTPIYLFIDMLTFALELNTSSIAPHILDTLIPIAQLTIDCVSIPKFQVTPPEPWAKCIEISPCMSLLYLVAQGCMSDDEHIVRYWKLMRWDFVMFLIDTKQDFADQDLMLDLLTTSVQKDMFGGNPCEEILEDQTSHILKLLSQSLIEIPTKPIPAARWGEAPIKFPVAQKWPMSDVVKLRTRILQLLVSMTRAPYSSNAMAIHSMFIGRLVLFISDELDVLYDYKAGHETNAQMITTATRLLYFLVTRHDNIINLQQKLQAIHGGAHIYLLCFSRLNYSEGDLVIESGIEPDIVGIAAELLDLLVSPEEGEAIYSAFVSPSV